MVAVIRTIPAFAEKDILVIFVKRHVCMINSFSNLRIVSLLTNTLLCKFPIQLDTI
jgi:hypothetical protein